MKKKFILLSVFFILLSSLVNAAEKPVVFVVSTGGTIASVNTEEGYKPGIMADELVKMVPEIRKHADLKSK
ncbi:MAG: asparaginase domain-containing protein, partial [Vulcanimicrobiota bacterium]